ncbi:MAG: exonuclease domain-containing protein [Rikenellaceae bacterium]
MKLNLTKPIIFFDLETTGIDIVKDRIVEISVLKVSPNGDEISKTRRINPGMPIPAEASAVHGIYDKDVENEPYFKDIAKSMAAFFEGCDLAGYNSDRFDIPMLAEEFVRAGVDIDLKRSKTVDVQTIFHKMEQRTLSAAYRFYCNENLEGAHSAEADTKATYNILLSQLDRYEELENSVDFLCDYTKRDNNVDFAGRIVYDKDGVEVFGFGKHKGKAVSEVFKSEPSYYSWIMNGDFPEYTKKVFTAIRLKSKQ